MCEIPFLRTGSSHGFCDRYAKRGVAVHDGDADFDLCDLSIKVPRHEALPQQFHTVHLRFDTASSVVSAPVSPDRTAEIFRRPQGLVSGDSSSGDGLPRLRVLAGRYDGMGAAVSDRVTALAGIISAVSGDAADLLACRDLAEQVGQDWCIADMALGDLDGSNLQCFLINSEMDLAPDPSFRTTVFAGVPFALSLDLDPGAIYQQVQQTLGAAIGD